MAIGLCLLLYAIINSVIKYNGEKQNEQQNIPKSIEDMPQVDLTPEQEREGVKAVYNDNGILLIDK